LAIVRALESLDQPSRVTLVTASRNVRRGLTYGLPLWRESAWQWERYGQMTPVKNGDLWRRIDRALAIHALDCRCRLEQTDDLAQPAAQCLSAAATPAAAEEPKVVTRRTRRGRVLRIDPAPAVDKRSKSRRFQEPEATFAPGRTPWFFGSSVLGTSRWVRRSLSSLRSLLQP
jgi:hypothetical protein